MGQRILITVDGEIPTAKVLRAVSSVVDEGRVSRDGKSCCHISVFGNGIRVHADLTRAGNDTFRVWYRRTEQ